MGLEETKIVRLSIENLDKLEEFRKEYNDTDSWAKYYSTPNYALGLLLKRAVWLEKRNKELYEELDELKNKKPD